MTSRNRTASPHFHTIKAVFQGPNAPPSRPSYRISRTSSPGSPTDQDVPNPALNLISREDSEHEQTTIDTVFGFPTTPTTVPSRLQTRTPVYLKPAWVGPPPPSRPATPGIMSQKVTITYTSPGLQPPVYVTTSLSDPEWEVLEMEAVPAAGDGFEFARTFHAQEGEYQYKFRLGPGDWWVCDEGKLVADDGFGNRNNLLVVKPEPPVKHHPASKEVAASSTMEPDVSQAEEMPRVSSAKEIESADLACASAMHLEEHKEDMAPLFAHESSTHHHHHHHHLDIPPEDIPVNFSRMDTQPMDDDDGDVEPSHHPGSPLFRHETLAPPSTSPMQTPNYTPGLDEDEDDPFEHTPLMKHEPAGPDAVEAEHAPLFSHESVGLSSPHQVDHSRASGKSSSTHHHRLPRPEDFVPKEADPNDPSLERFPTHHEGIMSSLRRASMRMSEDEVPDASHDFPASLDKSASRSSQHSSLPSVQEDEEEELISHKPKEQIASLDSKIEDFAFEAGEPQRPAAPITPPHTPDSSVQPATQAPHVSQHHHPGPAEADMLEESKHDVKHHDQDRNAAASLDGEGTPKAEEDALVDQESVEDKIRPETKAKDSASETEDKSAFGSFIDAVFGLGLMVLIGALAAWMAYKMQGANEDGAAAVAGA